jgi:hypothetical protein
MNVVICFVEIPPRVFTPKRLKVDPETTIKIEYFKENNKKVNYTMYLSFVSSCTLRPMTPKYSTKRGEVLKESGILAVTESQIYKHHLSILISPTHIIINRSRKIKFP